MTEDRQQDTESTSTFERVFGEVASVAFNIDCLQGILLDTRSNDRAILKRMMGDWVVMSSTAAPDVLTDLQRHLVYGISVFKALQVELCLKALLITERGAFPKKHDLLVLHDLLRSKTRQQLDEFLREAQDNRQRSAPRTIRMPSFRSIMEKHRGDFVAVRYGESKDHQIARLRDGMMNLDSAIDALMKACVHTPEGRPWLENAEPGLYRKI